VPEKSPLYPLLLTPSLQVKVWGGRKLQDLMGKTLPTDAPYGEAWEVHDTSIVANGALAGQTLGELLKLYGTDLVGEGNDPNEGFPLLAKILDANDWLSIQVHPNDEQALALEGQPRGKTEAWVILDVEPNSQLIIGVKSGTSREEMAQAIRNNTLEELVVYANVKVGDVLYLPANTVHALGPGLLIYEIQQSSNTTYRLYDFGRMGLDGNPRELHIDKGVQVSNLDELPTIDHPDSGESPLLPIIAGEFFKTMLYHLELVQNVPLKIDTNNNRFHALTCISGTATIRAGEHELTFTKGQTALIPATIGIYSLSGTGDVLRSWQTYKES